MWDFIDHRFRELKRREKQRIKDAHKAVNPAVQANKAVAKDDEVKSSDDDLNPNVSHHLFL